MKNVFLVAVLALILSSAVYADEPGPGQINVTAGGGLNVPSGEEMKNGYVIGGGVGVHATSRLVLGAEVSYLGYSKEEGTENNLGTPVDYSASQNFFTYMATGRYLITSGKAAPYIKGLAGRYTYSVDAVIGGMSLEGSVSDLQYGGGIGTTIRGGNESSLYLEALYHRLQGDDDVGEIFTFTMGMDLSIKL